jgi:hypothetical protein
VYAGKFLPNPMNIKNYHALKYCSISILMGREELEKINKKQDDVIEYKMILTIFRIPAF